MDKKKIMQSVRPVISLLVICLVTSLALAGTNLLTRDRIAELDRLFSSLYEDKVSGNISERNYKQLSAKYEAEQITLENQIGELEEKIRNSKAATENVDTFVNLIKDYSLITELNSAILHTLIEKIVVHEAEVIDGEKAQKIEIYYKFVGRI